ncbi:putative nucleic acid-binding protein [Sphingomonas sp. UYAg733]
MLIDTNIWIELARRRPEPKVIAFLAENSARCFLSTIVLAEIEYGIDSAPDPARRDRLIGFLDAILARCGDRVLSPDMATAVVWGKTKAGLEAIGQPIADIDLLIASQAIAAEMPLVTRNVSDMARTGAAIINPWDD